MGLFGHGGKLSKAGHKIGHTLEHYDEVLRNNGAPDFHAGYKANGDGTGGSFTGGVTGYNKGGNTAGKPAGYSRTTAKTATEIAQGGMTKEEVDNWNRNHPNETALRR